MAKRIAKPTEGEAAVRKRRRGRPTGQAEPAQADSNAVPSTVALNRVLPAETEQEVKEEEEVKKEEEEEVKKEEDEEVVDLEEPVSFKAVLARMYEEERREERVLKMRIERGRRSLEAKFEKESEEESKRRRL